MAQSFIKILIALQLVAVGYGEASGSMDRSNKVPGLELPLLLSKRYLTGCQIYYNKSYFLGEHYYQSTVSTCSELWVHSDLINGLFRSLNTPVRSDSDNYTFCRRLGWQMGFLQAHESRWQPCSQEIEVSIAEALEKHLEQCSQLGQNTAQALRLDILGGLDQKLENYSSEERRLIQFAFFQYLMGGENQKAWDFILSLHRNAYENLPCFKTFVDQLQ